ncbi:BTB domain-containing protein [Meloidogyne graminicola]|uniref:BTB domain-containing protein n=1 Tax=Meloidogyne graminicola TaxID=189291 RepID=A0A8S9ZXL4_9BILA|nr:BTB domain-containing protein [Meloidogyne graminicola]
MGYSEVRKTDIVDNDYYDIRLACEIEAYTNNRIINLQNTYLNMFDKGTFADCSIKVGDEVIKTHRCILAQNSEVFRKMFEDNGMTESQNGEIKISDNSPEAVHAMLKFFYTGVNILKDYVVDIFAIAHKYELEQLKYECELFMSDSISVENIVKYCHIINLYGDQILETSFKIYLGINSKSILCTKEWEDIENNYPQLAFRLLKNVIADSTYNK